MRSVRELPDPMDLVEVLNDAEGPCALSDPQLGVLVKLTTDRSIVFFNAWSTQRPQEFTVKSDCTEKEPLLSAETKSNALARQVRLVHSPFLEPPLPSLL